MIIRSSLDLLLWTHNFLHLSESFLPLQLVCERAFVAEVGLSVDPVPKKKDLWQHNTCFPLLKLGCSP
jgi:hypothetical protein